MHDPAPDIADRVMVGDGDDLKIFLNRRIHDGLRRHGGVGHIIRTIGAIRVDVEVGPAELRAVGELLYFVEDHLRARKVGSNREVGRSTGDGPLITSAP